MIVIISAIVLNKTRFGMRLKACGEYPQAADSVGVNVGHIRFAGAMICGFLAGMAGIMLIIPSSTEFNASVSGYGFLAVSVLILGQWKPSKIVIAAVFFGMMKTFAAAYSGIPFLISLEINPYIYRMIPFVVTLIVLAFSSKKSQGPAAAGQPFDKGMR